MSNEITVKIKCSVEEMHEKLKKKNFEVKENYILRDTYLIPKNIKIKETSIREILSKAVILREIDCTFPEVYKEYKLTFKKKEILEDGTILNQEKIDCIILNLENGRNLIEALGYEVIMNIEEKDTVYKNEDLEIAIKEITNGENLIEIETTENNSNLNTIDKLKQKVLELEIPIETDNYFVKKAEIELKKVMESK